jgi:hypothetical protein
MLGGGMNRRERADQLESVPFGAAGDQGVQPVLGCERIDHPRAPASESGITPLPRIGAMGGVPSLMRAVKVADTDVDHSHRCSRRRLR